MVKIKRAPVAGLNLLEGEIVKKDLKISGMSFKNVPVIPEVKNDPQSEPIQTKDQCYRKAVSVVNSLVRKE